MVSNGDLYLTKKRYYKKTGKIIILLPVFLFFINYKAYL